MTFIAVSLGGISTRSFGGYLVDTSGWWEKGLMTWFFVLYLARSNGDRLLERVCPVRQLSIRHTR